jgi:hypothetical protein
MYFCTRHYPTAREQAISASFRLAVVNPQLQPIKIPNGANPQRDITDLWAMVKSHRGIIMKAKTISQSSTGTQMASLIRLARMAGNLSQLNRMLQASKDSVPAAARLDIRWLGVIAEKQSLLKKNAMLPTDRGIQSVATKKTISYSFHLWASFVLADMRSLPVSSRSFMLF